jgi:phosphate transport system substrate-binding protein
LENGSGAYVLPSSYTIGQAGAQATHLSATNFSIIDESGPSTYPLANFSWTLLYKKQANAAKSAALDKLFHYVVTTGQQQAKSLGYSPLPANVAQLAKTTLAELQS